MSSPAMPTVTAVLQTTFSPSVAEDFNTQWLSMQQGSLGTLAAAIAPTDTSLTLTAPSAPGPTPEVGDTLLIDEEPMAITSVGTGGSPIGVTRAQMTPLAGAPAAHAEGAAVYLLTYPTWATMVVDQAIRPYAQQVVIGLGAESATFGATATGSLTVNSGS
jgi:hypothetical protein